MRAIAPQQVFENAILVPQQGIARDPKGDATAFVVGPDDVVEMREVQIVQAVGDKWLIKSGLESGDRVILEGTDKVRSGGKVVPVIPRNGPKALNHD